MKKKHTFIAAVVFFCLSFFLYPDNNVACGAVYSPARGVWVTVFTPEKVLYSRTNADKLIDTCVKCHITDIYLQIYRADKAYYDSSITDHSPYTQMVSEAGGDMIQYIIRKAADNHIRTHAWLNLLSIAQNKNADIIKKFGPGVLTLDQYGRTSRQKGTGDSLDKYYIRENQLFLEPGDNRVRNYLLSIISEIIKKYPRFSGIQLDYVRYPEVVPFIPGSRFTSHGISYGYASSNLSAFKKATGINMKEKKLSSSDLYKWDQWRRNNVTSIVQDVHDLIKKTAPYMSLSCTIVPSIERTYLTTFQDWTEWLNKGYADYVVTMNYTDDTRYMLLRAGATLIHGKKDKIYTGLGAFLMKNDPEKLETQILSLEKHAPAGIVLFSYANIASSKGLQAFLARTRNVAADK